VHSSRLPAQSPTGQEESRPVTNEAFGRHEASSPKWHRLIKKISITDPCPSPVGFRGVPVEGWTTICHLIFAYFHVATSNAYHIMACYAKTGPFLTKPREFIDSIILGGKLMVGTV